MVRISIRQGDITEVKADAIVNAANNNLWMGGGVAGAIKRRGGEAIEEEALKKGPIQVGTAVATGAGNLPAKYVVHAAVMGQDLKTDAEKIEQATMSSLKLADELKVGSIAFPALGTGVGGFPLQKAAKVMLQAVTGYLNRETSLQEVSFVLFSSDAYEAFAAEAAAYQGEHYLDLTD
ncbi:MAG: macro domain-containing protein [Chloroflexi bacterium]|nr:macro domain-containing protein [Chloroflexota bacterium]